LKIKNGGPARNRTEVLSTKKRTRYTSLTYTNTTDNASFTNDD